MPTALRNCAAERLRPCGVGDVADVRRGGPELITRLPGAAVIAD